MWGMVDVSDLGIIPTAGVNAETGAEVEVPLFGSPFIRTQSRRSGTSIGRRYLHSLDGFENPFVQVNLEECFPIDQQNQILREWDCERRICAARM